MSEIVEQRREAFRRWVGDQGGVMQVARKSGVPHTTLYSYLGKGGSDSLKGTTQQTIANAFGVMVDDLFGERTVPLVGYVGAGDAAHYYGASDELGRVRAPDNSNENTRASEIRGGSVGRIFDRWLIFYDEVRSPVTADMIGELCIVGLPDDRVLVKQIQAARGGLFHLISEVEPPMLDQEILWAAKVTGMRPR